jgi:L-threonylcarbamoyladenylate synthase
MKIVPPTAEGIAAAAAAIRAGKVVAYPTETVYGLAVDPFLETAIERLFEAKARDRGKPVLLIVADLDQLARVTTGLSEKARTYARAFWPGPLSLLLPKAPALPDALTAGSDKVCVRCPAHETARRLCQAVGGAITSSSANWSGQPPVLTLAELDLPGVTLAIDGGALAPSAPSTVFDPDLGILLREGVITKTQLDQVPFGPP